VTFLAAAAVVALGASPAAAAGLATDVVVSNTETVQAYLTPTGELDVARIYDQVAMSGQGTVDLVNPVSTEGLRNLDRFGGFEVEDGAIVGTYEVDGDLRLRAVSDFTKELPLEVSVTYLLDGEEVEPGDVVGRTGELEVRYLVRNVTGQPQEITFDDGTGTMATTTEDVVIPMVGSLSTVLPPSFTDVTSGEANMAGDGRGGTRMSFTMTLFGPIGTPEASFGYRAHVTDAVIPPASISALPVSPLESPSFKGGAASYESGATTGVTLTAGATQIDENLLKLRDGAGELLAGLIRLQDGAQTLSAGLSGTAVPGAEQLADGAYQAADGAAELSSGVNQLDDGANALSAGAGQVAEGADSAKSGADQLAGGSAQVADGLTQAGLQAPQLIAGLDQVAAGLAQVDAGLGQLYGGIGNLPAQAQPLHDGITKLRAGIGSKTEVGTIIYGVNAVNAALAGTAVPGINMLIDSAYNTSPTAPGSYQRLDCAQEILTDVIDGTLGGGERTAGSTFPCYRTQTNPTGVVPPLAGLTDSAGDLSETVTTSVRDNLESSLAQIVADTTNPNAPNSTTLVGGLNALKIGLDDHVPGTYGPTDQGGAQYALTAVNCGLDNTTSGACDSSQPGVLQGLSTLDAGITQLVNTVVATVQGAVGDDNDTAADKTLRGGVNDLEAGVDQLSAGGTALVLGLDQLSAGAKLVAEGNADLAVGLGTLAAGAGQVSSGADQLADGTGQAAAGASALADGNQQIAEGAGQLADGLMGAADGSSQIAEGLGTAAEGAPALEDGAQRLSDEGTKKLIEAGKSTAADYGAKYALIEAGAERALEEGMIYGAPEDALASAAYSFEIAGADGAGGRNVGRGLAAAAVFGLAAGAVVLKRQVL
jgi:putative membrane protein